MVQRRSSAEVSELVEEFRKSGLSQRAFAEEIAVPMSTLAGWVRRRAIRAATSGALVPVVSAPRPSATNVARSVIRLELPCGTRAEVPSDISRSALTQLLAVLDPRSC